MMPRNGVTGKFIAVLEMHLDTLGDIVPRRQIDDYNNKLLFSNKFVIIYTFFALLCFALWIYF